MALPARQAAGRSRGADEVRVTHTVSMVPAWQDTGEPLLSTHFFALYHHSQKMFAEKCFFPRNGRGSREQPGRTENTLDGVSRERADGERCSYAVIADARARRCGHSLLTLGIAPLEFPALRMRK